MAKAQAVLALQGGSSAAIYDNVAVTTLNPIMSRGLGHIERTILRMERQRRRKQRVSFDALDIVLNAYPHREGWDSRAHFVAVHRAMHSFVRKHLQFALVGGKGGGDWTLFRVGTVGLPSRLIDCRASRLLIGKS